MGKSSLANQIPRLIADTVGGQLLTHLSGHATPSEGKRKFPENSNSL